MSAFWFRTKSFIQFYLNADTKYQLHSPFVFELAKTVLEDKRWYYAFRDIERIRAQMLASNVGIEIRDYGTGQDRIEMLSKLVKRSSSSVKQGRMLFRMANLFQPANMLELGSSAGIGTMYLKAGSLRSPLLSLEGSEKLAELARINLEIAGLENGTEVLVGAFEKTLLPALRSLQNLDFVFVDGNHQMEATLQYFEQCLSFAHEKTVFVFDDMHWSPDMKKAWSKIQAHDRISLTVDFYELSLAFIDPAFKQKQHFRIVPSFWKIWKVF
ncbi:MAG: class I SAM-dependent methyltransferase [Saprospiraceae bacterium]